MPEKADLIQGPIQLAIDMIRFQQERIASQLESPDKPQRREMVGDTPLNDIMPTILARMELEE